MLSGLNFLQIYRVAAQGRAHVFARYAPEIITGRVAAELRFVLSGQG